MAQNRKDRFTLKIIGSYMVLALLTATVSYFIYTEIKRYLSTQTATENDAKLIRTGSLLTGLYEAETLSKLALQTKTKGNFTEYEKKIDSLLFDITVLKGNTEESRQKALLDSIRSLLLERVNNNNELRKLKLRSEANNSLDDALKNFQRLEASLGTITAEALAPNYKSLSPKAQEVIRDIADYLNENVPDKDKEPLNRKQLDSVLAVSKALITEAKLSVSRSQRILARKEQEILQNDLALSQQLRGIVSAIEEEVLLNSIYDSRKREEALRQGVRIAVIATAFGLAIVVLFTFLILKDYWQVQNYRRLLEKQKSITESLLKSREQLISTVSHDLRTPLNAISGYSELMEAAGLTPKQKAYLVHLRSASAYVDRLVNDLLDFSKLASGKIKIENVPFILSSIIRETSENLEKIHSDKKGIELIREIDPGLENTVIGDPFRIRQILSNLIGNAFKFTHQGSVTVRATIKSRKQESLLAVIEVIDTGIGIPKNKQQIIFQEFKQADERVEHTYGGYGLGLTISKKLTELLGGTLSVRSKPDQGSTFALQLPLRLAQAPLKPEETDKTIETSIEAILIIDDDNAMLQLLEEMCLNLGIRAITFSDFNKLAPDADISYQVVLTDIQMPHTDGFQVLQKLRSTEYTHFQGQPVIAMTGRRDMDTSVYRDKGFSEALRKPFTKQQLLELLYLLFPAPELKEAAEKPQKTISSNTAIFSLDTLYSFLGDDEDACSGILLTFIEETKANMAELEKAVVNRDLKALNRTAHRMLPMFRQFKATPCIEDLEVLEILEPQEKSQKTILGIYNRLSSNIKVLLEAQELYLNATSPSHND
jgi:signal transduction histidine kinase/FixJ family two-component response regulator